MHCRARRTRHHGGSRGCHATPPASCCNRLRAFHPPSHHAPSSATLHLQERRECGGGGQTPYALTPLSRCLTKQDMADLLLFESSQAMLASWHALSSYARSGSPPPFVTAHGEDLWSYAAKHAEFSKLLNKAMACDARNAVASVLDGCSGTLEGLSTVVDVGGGTGTVLRGLVEACSWIRGINFDLPHVVRDAPECPRIVHVGVGETCSAPFLRQRLQC